MTELNLTTQGAASAERMLMTHNLWIACAKQSGIDLTHFNPNASFEQRIAWAVSIGLTIGTMYTRYSIKRQGSTDDQIRFNIEFAARNRIYCPPELLCIDEGTKGRKKRRDGFERVQQILKMRQATCLLVFKLSRLYRQMYKSVQFVNEELVEEGMRAIAVSQGVDTNDTKTWKLQVSLHGTMDEELLSAIADHVREGLVGLFLKNWVTGAIPVGYMRKELPDAPRTRRNLPRTMPAVDPAVAAMIVQHYQWIADGMGLAEGWRRWRAAGGAVDKRCGTGHMGYNAYLRMLSRAAYIGIWEFCRKRNFWMSKKDMVEQRNQPPEEVKVLRCEELRIVPEELFWKVQTRLNAAKRGPRVRRDVVHQLWDLVIGVFHCAVCKDPQGRPRRYHMCGGHGQYMRCPNPECPQRAMVDRREAVRVLCAWASGAMRSDAAFIDLILEGFEGLDGSDKESLDHGIEAAERKIQSTKRRIAGLEDLIGTGSDEDDRRRRPQIMAAQSERSSGELELAGLRRQRGGGRVKPVTREEVTGVIAELFDLLNGAASGGLGAEVSGKAVTVFERLVRGSVIVHAQRRAGRKRWTIQGRFTPDLVGAIRTELGALSRGAEVAKAANEIEVCFRKPPRVDDIADEVRQLYEVEGLGFRQINKQLQEKYQELIGTGNCCAAYRRWYEVRKLPLPEPRTKTGRPRKKAS